MSTSRNGNRADMTLLAIGDTEVLAMVEDVADENGWATVAAVQWQMGEDPFAVKRSMVGGRLGWLRRYGWVERGERQRVDPDEGQEGRWRWTQTYRLTAMGQMLLDNPGLSRAVERALEGLNPAQRLHMVRELGEAGSGSAPELHHALRREWKRSMRLRY
jgi:hypothetical protein